MADEKLTQLTAATTLSVGDILYAVRDPLTVPISRKITLNNLLIAINSLYVGWVPVTDAWAYASATTITVPSGAASLYNKGDKVRFKQGAGYKYYYIITVADTLLTVTGGSDYTVANAAITDVYYSKIENPLDFPPYFNYAPVLAQGASTNIAKTTSLAIFTVKGGFLEGMVRLDATAAGTAGSIITVSAPLTATNTSSDIVGVGSYYKITGQYAGSIFLLSTTTFYLEAGADTTPGGAVGVAPALTVALGDAFQLSFRYRLA